MTQKKFNRQMATIYELQGSEALPHKKAMNQIEVKRKELEKEMLLLKLKDAELYKDFLNEQLALQEVNTKYHAMKHELNLEWQRQESGNDASESEQPTEEEKKEARVILQKFEELFSCFDRLFNNK